MEFKEYSAKTLDEAITKASVDLGVTSTELFYEITEKGSGGILGFGRRDVTIKACKKSEVAIPDPVIEEKEPESEPVVVSKPVKEETYTEKPVVERESRESFVEKAPEKEQPVLTAEEKASAEASVRSFLKDVFDAMGLEVEMTTSFNDKDNSLLIDFSGEHMGIIIGKRGQTLDSLQYLVNLVVNKHTESYVRIKLDTEDYRKRRKETLENLAKNIAYKVRKSGKPVTLEAMNPYERRTIHYALQKDRYVTTYSEGEEPFRHVVVTIKK